SLGTALGAYKSKPATIARQTAMAAPAVKKNGAVIVGTRFRTTPELAAFANGAHIRYLDYNDTYLSLEPAHPSDNIAATLAAAQANGRSGRDLILATVIAYEIQCRLCDAASLRANGWDHVTYGNFSATLGAGKLYGLSPEQMVHAQGLAGVCNIATRQTRTGQISMWKACAFSNVCRGAIFAVNLARQGFTGPHEIFEGPKGVFKMLTGRPFDVELGSKDAGYMINKTYIKFWPAEYHAQSSIDAALQIRSEFMNAGSTWADIDRVEMESFEAAVSIIGSEKEKWRPTSRETADHSMGYMTIAALVDGNVTRETFEPARFTDAKYLDLLDRTTIVEAADMNAGYPEGIPNRLRVHMKDGRSFEKTVKYPRGHAGNPMTDTEVESKFRTLASGVISEQQQDRLLASMWKMDAMDNVASLWDFEVGAKVRVAKKATARRGAPGKSGAMSKRAAGAAKTSAKKSGAKRGKTRIAGRKGLRR
ncbi:MAG TPA: MmgE/PrpD family protein, partial [Phycisphaerae bacterium]|nr:MmgE/PrpD family protein [Phycisphaerae bacterium]